MPNPEQRTTDERIQTILCPAIWKWSKDSDDRIARLAERMPRLGAVFLGSSLNSEAIAAVRERFRSVAGRAPLFCMDLENGPGPIFAPQHDFPTPMAIGAAHRPDPGKTLAAVRAMGRATAHYGHAAGCAWALGPVVDLNTHPDNPIVQTRSFGDDAESVAALASAQIEGIQKRGIMAATAKHFPGDGRDDRDQHYVTSVNPLGKQAWMESEGRVWRTAIDAGVRAIMSGHIALPSADPGTDFRGPPPATLSRKIQLDLLRGELGFDGLIVSDAVVMGGVQSHLPASAIPAATLAAGTDMLLFADAEMDAERIREGLESGAVTEARLDDAVRRFHRFADALSETVPPPPPADEEETFRRASGDLNERTVTLVRDVNDLLPLDLSPSAPLLLVHLEAAPPKDPDERRFAALEEELRRRGFQLTVLENPSHYEIFEHLDRHDAVFVNLHTRGMPGTRRLVGPPLKSLWRAFWTEHPRVIATSFDSPYHLRDLPSLPVLLNAYGCGIEIQKTAVRVWLGERPARGRSPVRLEAC